MIIVVLLLTAALVTTAYLVGFLVGQQAAASAISHLTSEAMLAQRRLDDLAGAALSAMVQTAEGRQP